MSEAELLNAVLSLARVYSWRILHIRPAWSQRGWRTPLMANGIGWPDVFACRGNRIVAAELKSRTGRLTSDQETWLDVLRDAGCEVYVWRPADWRSGTILAVLGPSRSTVSHPVGSTGDDAA